MLERSPITTRICITYLSHCSGKIPDKSSLKKEKLVFGFSSRVKSTVEGKAWREGLEAAAYTEFEGGRR